MKPALAQPPLDLPQGPSQRGIQTSHHSRASARHPKVQPPSNSVAWFWGSARRGGSGQWVTRNNLDIALETLPSTTSCTACIWIHPEPAVCETLRPRWGVERHLGGSEWARKGSTSLMGDHQSTGFNERADDPGEQQADNPYSGPDPRGAVRGRA